MMKHMMLIAVGYNPNPNNGLEKNKSKNIFLLNTLFGDYNFCGIIAINLKMYE